MELEGVEAYNTFKRTERPQAEEKEAERLKDLEM